MQENPLFTTKKGKWILFGILAFVIVGLLAVLIAVMNRKEGDDWQKQEIAPQVDPVSGETIWDIDQDDELEPELQLIGFYQLMDFGFMAKQYNTVIDTVTSYINENFPNVKRASYKKDSFKYLDAEWMKSSFEFVTDEEKAFMVTLDTAGSISEISVTINAM